MSSLVQVLDPQWILAEAETIQANSLRVGEKKGVMQKFVNAGNSKWRRKINVLKNRNVGHGVYETKIYIDNVWWLGTMARVIKVDQIYFLNWNST